MKEQDEEAVGNGNESLLALNGRAGLVLPTRTDGRTVSPLHFPD